MVFFAWVSFIFIFSHLISSDLTESQNRGKRMLRFKIAGAKSQSLKSRGKITIAVWNRGRNTKFPKYKLVSHRCGGNCNLKGMNSRLNRRVRKRRVIRTADKILHSVALFDNSENLATE
jgi:hypothetical protein